MLNILDIITDWIKGILRDCIMGNLDGMFDQINSEVGEVAANVGTTPAAWNAGVFSMIRNLSDNVVVPIAGMIITFVLCYELISMLMEKNNFHDDVCCKRCISSASNTTYSHFICGTNEMTGERIGKNGRINLYESWRLLHSKPGT